MRLTFTILLAMILSSGTIFAANIYVKDGASGANNGSSWSDAYTTLTAAIAASASGDIIYVAKGTYYPHASDRTVSFEPKPGTILYGGFEGTETSITASTLISRDFVTNKTILSGDIDKNDDKANNSYTVVMYDGYNNSFSSTSRLDGFTITGGNADQDNAWNETRYGGGIFLRPGSNKSVSPVLSNLVISGNYAIQGGGVKINSLGNANATVSPQFINVRFLDNHANGTYGTGGAIEVSSQDGSLSAPTFIQCSFIANYSQSSGGAAYIIANGSNVTTNSYFYNCTFTNNVSIAMEGFRGSQLYFTGQNSGVCNGTVYNTIIWGDETSGNLDEAEFTEGTTNLTQANNLIRGNGGSNPYFVDANGADDTYGTIDDDVRILNTSPAFDNGNSTYLPTDSYDIDYDGNTTEQLPLDADLKTRITGALDQGAYETEVTTSLDNFITEAISIYPNPSNGIFNLNLKGNEAQYVEVYDVAGNMVYKDQHINGSYSINLSSMVNGSYIVILKLNDKIVRQMVIKN